MEQRLVPAINVVTRSGAMTQVQNKEKQPDEALMLKEKKRHLWNPKKTLLIQAHH